MVCKRNRTETEKVPTGLCVSGRGVSSRRLIGLRVQAVLMAAAINIGRRATVLYAPSGRRSDFSGHPCPEIADCGAVVRTANPLRKMRRREDTPLPHRYCSADFPGFCSVSFTNHSESVHICARHSSHCHKIRKVV